jgi:hypothetical protein
MVAHALVRAASPILGDVNISGTNVGRKADTARVDACATAIPGAAYAAMSSTRNRTAGSPNKA